MKVLLNFTKEDIERLYLTFQRNPTNYHKIKERVVGEGARQQFRREMRGRWIFLAAITIVAIVSSLYPMAAGDWRSVGALWVVWAGFIVVFTVWYVLSYRFSYSIVQQNESFFESFESVANASPDIEAFRKKWAGQ